MGRSVTPTYRVECRVNVGSIAPMCWDGKRDGRATQDNLEKWRQFMNESFVPGGVNFRKDDVVLHISRAKLVHQRTGRVVAETVAPMFEVV